ncbi:YraN family protein [Candidatus Dependentiae bacterium]|mgnify:CR=1 FL=1|nr:YraN family protein [Candidatus Dependentiae bacterium]
MNYESINQPITYKELGKYGESVVEQYYLNKKFKLLAKNFICKKGELDLIFITSDSEKIIAVEVKTRAKFEILKNPAESITKSKRKKIISALKYYCFVNNIKISDYYFRFDAASVYINNYPDDYEIDVIENAFDEKGTPT